MKQQLKRLLYLFVVGIIFFLGCQTEEIPVSESKQKHIRQVTKVSFSTFKKLTGLADFKTIFELPKNNSSFVSRRANGSYAPDDFIVDTDQITQTIVDGKTAYSFPISPLEGKKEENRFYLVVYDKVGSWLDMIIESDVSMDATGNPQETGFREIYASAARGTGCTTVFTWVIRCNGGGKCAEGICDLCSQCLKADSHRICGGKDEEDYNDGGLTEPGQPGGGGGTNPNPNPDPEEEVIVTLPILVNPKETPCAKLKKLSSAAGYAHMISELKIKAAGPKEYGWVYKHFPNSTSLAPPTVAGNSTKDPTKVDLAAFRSIEWLGVFHNHTEAVSTRSVQMFSPADVEWILIKGYKLSRDNTTPRYSDLFVGLVVQNGVYCLKIKDWSKFSRFLTTAVFEDFKKDLEDLNDIDTPTASKETHEKTFLKILKDKDLGVGLFEQDEYGNWNELELDPQNNENPPKKIPCN